MTDDRAKRAACSELRDELLSLCERGSQRLDLSAAWILNALNEATATIIIAFADGDSAAADRWVEMLIADMRDGLRKHYNTPSGKPS